MSTRDTQRSRVYAAERRAFGYYGNGFESPEYDTTIECWHFAQKVIRSAMFGRSYPMMQRWLRSDDKHPMAWDFHDGEWFPLFDDRGKRIEWGGFRRATHIGGPVGLQIRSGQGARMARGGGQVITLPAWARSKPVILHELSHCVATGAQHGWRFCETYLRLVHIGMGADARDRLKAEFDQPGRDRVRYRKPRAKRQLTPEQKAELTERLARAREAKAANVRSE